MPVNLSIISINAPVQKVWNALTDPSLVKQWQYGSELTTGWQPGHPIRFRTEWEGTVYEQWGHVLIVEPFNKLSYSLFAPRPGHEDKPENYFEMRYELEEKEGTVILKIIQEDNRPGAVQEETQGEENPVLAMLKGLCEG